ncbi:MAG: hypothetical protein KY468_09965 [Armatimonadetes bacterium]|nr:hypothetical protein [Armatimonadota bacterium]
MREHLRSSPEGKPIVFRRRVVTLVRLNEEEPEEAEIIREHLDRLRGSG